MAVQKKSGAWLLLAAATLCMLSLVWGVNMAWADTLKGTVVVDKAKLSYEVKDGEATITKIEHAAGKEAGAYDVVVPDTVTVEGEDGAPNKAYLVTAIASNACGTSVTKELGNRYTVVQNNQIARVTLPSRLLSVGESAFAGCTTLTHVEFATDADGRRSLQSIGDFAFYGSAIDEALIPDTVTSVGTYAFAQCSNVKSIHLPASQLVIHSAAFDGTENFTKVEIPEGCTSMPSLTMNAHVDELSIPSSMAGTVHLSHRSAGSLGLLEFPAYMGNAKLEINTGESAAISAGGVKDALPEGPESISLSGDFRTIKLPSTLKYLVGLHSDALEEVVIPKSVLELGNSALANNPLLHTVRFEEDSDLATVKPYAFSNCPQLENVQLPAKLNVLGGSAFAKCSALAAMTIPADVVSLGGFPFDGCGNLESISFAPGKRQAVLDITGLARDCPKLRRVVLPDAATPHEINGSSQLWKFLENCPALEGIYTYDPDLKIDESWISGCGDFKVYGWGVEGAVLDYAEYAGHEFVPYAELDESGFNGAANASVAVHAGGHASASVAFSSPSGADYRRTLVEGSDYAFEQELSGGDTYLVLRGLAADEGQPQTCFGELRLPIGRDIGKAFAAPIPTQVFFGSPVRPAVRLTWSDGASLKAGADYLLTYEGNEAPGMACAVFTGIGSYAGSSKTVSFSIIGEPFPAGDDRVTNALSAARKAFGQDTQPDTVVLAWSHDYATTFAADAYAAAKGIPILLSSNKALSTSVKDQLKAWGVNTALVVGSLATSDAVLADLSSLGIQASVVAGDAVQAGVALRDRGAAEGIWQGGSVMANASDFGGAMAAATYAAAMRMPLLYADPDGTASQSVASRLGGKVMLVGDRTRLDASIEESLASTVDVSRIQGSATDIATGLLEGVRAKNANFAEPSLCVVASENATAYTTWPASALILEVLVLPTTPTHNFEIL